MREYDLRLNLKMTCISWNIGLYSTKAISACVLVAFLMLFMS